MRIKAAVKRKIRRFLGIGLLTATLGGCGPGAEPAREHPESAAMQVSPERFRAHMAILAHDRMEGRETGTDGYLMAAEYVAAQFAQFGLMPLGDQGRFFQEVPFLSTRLDADSASLEITRKGEALALVFGEDFVAYPSFSTSEESVTAPLLFVGYGVHAPRHGHDDFAGVVAEGSILVRFTGAPPGFPADERAYYSSGRVKDGFAVERGAVGVITVRTPIDLPRLPWGRYTSAVGSSDMRWTGPDGRPFETHPDLRGEAVVSEAGAAKLFAFAGQDLEALFARLQASETASFELELEATLTRGSVHSRQSAPNVIGFIPGSDPDLRDEYLLYTAHLDHLGVRGDDSGTDTYNGAYDNAAGVATILEVARTMGSNPDAVRRSVIFAALTGEEKGLQGSSYLAHNAPWPIDNLVAVINIDMPYLGFPIAEIMGLGVEHSSLQAVLVNAAQEAGLEYVPDPRPELVRFIRSDQFSFVRRGVPGLNLKPGTRSSDPRFDGPVMHEAFLRVHYHQPSDRLDLAFSPEGAARFTRVALLMGLEVSNSDRRPEWNAGDFFGHMFTDGSP